MKRSSEEWNVRMAKLLGYEYQEDGVSYSIDSFSPEEKYTILSRVPIITSSFPRGNETIKAFSIVEPENKDEWAEEIIEEGGVPWNVLHAGEFIYLKFWNPDRDWNQLMKVARKAEIFRTFTDINQAYEEVCEKISKKI